jgi:hypothetical protein
MEIKLIFLTKNDAESYQLSIKLRRHVVKYCTKTNQDKLNRYNIHNIKSRKTKVRQTQRHSLLTF